MTDTQKVILSIFKEISIICSKHNIPYFAIGGTCIGAVRHKGFIPWDDDLDIAVPIESFDYLLDCLRKEISSALYVIDGHEPKHYHYVWAKVCNRNTTFIEKSEYHYKDAYKGVFVDIMPISGVPEGARRRVFYRTIKTLYFLNNTRRFPVITNGGPLKKLIKIVLKGMVSILPYNFFFNKYLKYLKKFPFRSSKYTGYVWYPEEMERLTFPQEYFKETVEVQFEDALISIPKQFDSYLKYQFGDYMKFPSEEKRLIHDGLVDLVHPYSYYYGKL